MQILNWLKKILLPFEFEDHPLHTPPPYDPGSDPDWDDLGEEEEEESERSSYSRIPFYRSPQWERWGGKWYKKG